MRLKEKFLLLLLTVFGIVFLVNCDGNSSKSEDPEGYADEVMIDASVSGKWIYFSFEQADTVSESDDWDLKFQRYHIGTNSGTSGDGEGGALDMGDLDFASVTEVPTSDYTVDSTKIITGHSGDVSYNLNTVLAGWTEMQGMPPVFVPSEHIYAIKTHDGKYAKVQFLSYYNEEITDGSTNSGYVTFKYYYQPNGDSEFTDDDSQAETFESLESPYLICAGRNPGGVGFDFVWKGQTGGAQNIDENAALKWDIKIKTIKGEKTDGSLGGAPACYLDENVKAAQAGTGEDFYNNLTSVSSDIKNALKTDAADFSLDSLETGSTGKPLMSELKKQYKKLAIGDKFKEPAMNDDKTDDIVWVIETREGEYVKLMFTEFPAKNAPTETGYFSAVWELIQ